MKYIYCTNCGSENIMAIQYGYPHPEHYDGVSEYLCQDCGYREGRWSHQELKEGYSESRWGERGAVQDARLSREHSRSGRHGSHSLAVR